MNIRKGLEKALLITSASTLLLGASATTYLMYQHKTAEQQLLSSSNVSDIPTRMKDLNKKIASSADSTIGSGFLMGVYGLVSMLNKRKERKANTQTYSLYQKLADETSNSLN